jgi:carbamoyl-phosphate synthase large subunit
VSRSTSRIAARTSTPLVLGGLIAAVVRDGAVERGLVRTYKARRHLRRRVRGRNADYYYSTSRWQGGTKAPRRRRPAVVILGSGPTASARASSSTTAACTPRMTFASSGRETVMVNCNPETVSTDYDTSDRLYFEPLTLEDVLAVCEREQPEGVIVQFGGQTPLKLARGLAEAGVPMLGTPPSRSTSPRTAGASPLLDELGIRPPVGDRATRRRGARRASRSATRCSCALVRARRAGDGDRVRRRRPRRGLERAVRPTLEARRCSRPLPRGRDRGRRRRDLPTATTVVIGGVMQHVEEAGVHSGDSACVIPPLSLGPQMERSGEDDAPIALGSASLGSSTSSSRSRRRRALRARGQPARLAHGAVRVEGDGGTAREDRLSA